MRYMQDSFQARRRTSTTTKGKLTGYSKQDLVALTRTYERTGNDLYNPGITPDEWRALNMPKATEKKKDTWLKPEHLPEKGTVEMTIVGNCRTYEGDYGFKLNMDVKIKGKVYTFGIKPNNPGLREIINNLASGKKIEVQRGEYKGNDYVQVVLEED